MKADETTSTYLLRAQEYFDALANIGEPVKEKDLVILVISGLREEYNGLKSTLLARQSPTSFQDLHGLLVDHDFMIKKNSHTDNSTKTILLTGASNNRLYSICLSSFQHLPKVAFTTLKTPSDTWHHRLMHPHPCFQGEVSSFLSDSMCVQSNVEIVSGANQFNVQIVSGTDQLNDDDIGIECESATYEKQLDNVAQEFIEKMGRVMIGPMKAYRIMQEFRGSNNVEEDPSLTFEFICDKGKLVSLFWADEAVKVNYREFGDVVSFDATFRTTKYRMVFVPFTGIDNHRKSVTFAIGILHSETIESYLWLLKTFLKTFGKQPTVVQIDEDAAMKIAIERIFPYSRHRLCIWHITQKLSSKVCAELSNDMKFKKCFNKLIWNSRIDASEFDIRWRSFIEDYKLQEVSWFSKMFDIRESWIPTYFRDMPLSGLMRTTSRSESMNYAFNKVAHWGNSLVKFFDSFDSAMDRQRHN
ncbi:protein FAR1-RELATED SEQUENCE 3-like [Lactuca sativa]|uniref:protein FAR1-RELATED SEQUENCE 3-like n=1 Tax=Lactuca sativa TaxID=4236 RepID=UPI0022AF4890|nr:protein FAR1-RELATED SEQUENCE 3-like [Lactuca sativa]